MPPSLELFVPRLHAGPDKLESMITAMTATKPPFISVSGAPDGRTLDFVTLVTRLSSVHRIPVQVHLHRSEVTLDGAASFVDKARALGVQHVLILGGEPGTTGAAKGTAHFSSTSDLVRCLKERYGQKMSIAVCGHPRGSVGEAGTYEADIAALAEQVTAGADRVISSPTFDADAFEQYEADLRTAGVCCPVHPTLLPVHLLHSRGELKRLARALHLRLPEHLLAELAEMGDGDGEAMRKCGSRLFASLYAALVSRRAAEGTTPAPPHVATLNSLSALEEVKKLAPELLAVSAVLDSPAAPGGRGQICGGRVSVLYSGESAAQIAALLAGHLGEQLVSPPASVDGINTDALRATSASTSGAASTLLFLLECEQDGMLAADARKLQRELKKAADSACLAGCHVAVLALARSVCAFSAASTGADKYSGATKLQAAVANVLPQCERPDDECRMPTPLPTTPLPTTPLPSGICIAPPLPIRISAAEQTMLSGFRADSAVALLLRICSSAPSGVTRAPLVAFLSTGNARLRWRPPSGGADLARGVGCAPSRLRRDRGRGGRGRSTAVVQAVAGDGARRGSACRDRGSGGARATLWRCGWRGGRVALQGTSSCASGPHGAVQRLVR